MEINNYVLYVKVFNINFVYPKQFIGNNLIDFM